MATTATVAMRDRIEDAGYHFLKDGSGWALYDLDDRSEVDGTRSTTYGKAIWAAAAALHLED